jgi:hypothetical protein
VKDSYKLALSEAKDELRDIDKVFNDLASRRERVTGLIKMLESIVDPEPQPSATPQPDPDETVNLFGRTEPLWMLIARAMKKHGHPFTLATAGLEVERWTGVSLGVNRPQKVRNAVIRHPEMFQKDEDAGTYTLIGEVG